MNKKQFMGIVTVSLIVGGTVYCIKKYKDSQVEEAPLTVEEAKALLEAKRLEDEANESTTKVAELLGMDRDEIEELVDEARDEASWNSSFDQDAGYDFYDGLDYTKPLAEYITEEDKQLRFDPNTIQARDHFIKMELAELIPNQPEYQVLKRLFDIPFEPLNEGDESLYYHLLEHRTQFFGPHSRWNENVSMSDVITYFARRTDYEIGGGVGHWLMEFVRNVKFNELATTDELHSIAVALNQHKFFNPNHNAFSFFRLSPDEYEGANQMSDETMDGEITYEIEFNTFLKIMM